MAAQVVKSLPSQLDEIEAVLGAIPAPLQSQHITAFQELSPVAATQQHDDSSSKYILDWSALPTSVDADSTAMGVSTRKKTAKQQAKQRAVNQEKVQARVARKRAQVESFLLALQPLLQAAGHGDAVADLLRQASTVAHAAQDCTCSNSNQLQQHPEHQQTAACPAQGLLQHQQHQQLEQQQLPLCLHIVDFGCGSGNLLLPLAALLPHCRFTGVDMKPAALQLLQQRANAAGLTNVCVFEGMIEAYSARFDVGLALHACGNATDHVLQMAVDQGAAFVVSPCCVGKLVFSLTGGSSFHSQPITWTPTQPGDRPVLRAATAASTQGATEKLPPHQDPDHHQQQQQQQPPQEQEQEQQDDSGQTGQQQQQQQGECQGDTQHTVCPIKLRHPRSDWLMGQLPQPQRHFRIMAKVADLSHTPGDATGLAAALKHRAAVADTCKRFVELDRCAAAAEAGGYAVGLFKVLQAHTMAKNDLLIGLPATLGAVATPAGADVLHAASGQQPEAGSPSGLCRAAAVDRCLQSCGDALASRGVLYTGDRLECAVRPHPDAELSQL